MIRFFSDGEKRAERCGSKMDESEVGVNQKYVTYTHKKLLTLVHTNALPSCICDCCAVIGCAWHGDIERRTAGKIKVM